MLCFLKSNQRIAHYSCERQNVSFILICVLKSRQKKIDEFTLKVYAFPLWPMNQFPFSYLQNIDTIILSSDMKFEYNQFVEIT